ncbi:MAG: glutaredoxin 3 [Alphaproteobacteria bacterium]
MADILIYTSTTCPYCVRAKRLLEKKGAAYQELNVETSSELRDEMLLRSNGRRTVPQIFIHGQHVGGCDDLYAMESAGTLDGLLRGEGV